MRVWYGPQNFGRRGVATAEPPFPPLDPVLVIVNNRIKKRVAIITVGVVMVERVLYCYDYVPQ